MKFNRITSIKQIAELKEFEIIIDQANLKNKTVWYRQKITIKGGHFFVKSLGVALMDNNKSIPKLDDFVCGDEINKGLPSPLFCKKGSEIKIPYSEFSPYFWSRINSREPIYLVEKELAETTA
jgi:hypothetical protein